MKVDNDKVLRKQREKNKTILLAARRREKEEARRYEAADEVGPEKKQKNH